MKLDVDPVRQAWPVATELPSHPQRVDPPQPSDAVPPDPARVRAGVWWALLAHLVPSGLTLPAVAVLVYVAHSGVLPLGEGVFALMFLLLAAVGLQTLLALGCLIAAAVAYRGDPGLGHGLVAGWVIGVAALGAGGMISGYLWSLTS
jgi:hypothetical protein